MKKNQRTLQLMITIFLLSTVILSGCVTKGRFMAQVSETQTLAQRLDTEEKKNADLEKKLARQNEALEKLQSEYDIFKTNAAQQQTELEESLTARKKAL